MKKIPFNTSHKITRLSALCVLFALFCFSATAQSNGQTAKRWWERPDRWFFKSESFRTSRDATDIPDTVLMELKLQTEHALLYYRMIANPEIKPDSFIRMEPTARVTLSPEYVLFNPSIAGKGYHLILDVKRWPRADLPWWKNFYLITKKGNRFTDYTGSMIRVGKYVKDWIPVPPFQDTLHFDLWSKSFPYDERYIVYYDEVKQKIHPIGGAMCLEPIQYWNWIPRFNNVPKAGQMAVYTRLDRYGIREGDNGGNIASLVLMPPFQKDSVARDSVDIYNEKNWGRNVESYNLYYFLEDGLDVSDGYPVLARVPINRLHICGEVEFLFYKPIIDTTYCTVSWKKYDYYLHNVPKNYEETLPTIRDVPQSEIDSIRKTPYSILVTTMKLTQEIVKCLSK